MHGFITWRSSYTATQIVAIGKTFDIVPFMNYVAYVWLLSEFTDKDDILLILCDFNGLIFVDWFSRSTLDPLLDSKSQTWPIGSSKCSKAVGRQRVSGSKFNAGLPATTVPVFLRNKTKHSSL